MKPKTLDEAQKIIDEQECVIKRLQKEKDFYHHCYLQQNSRANLLQMDLDAIDDFYGYIDELFFIDGPVH